MPNTTTFTPRDLRSAKALLLTRAALFAAWDVITTQGGAYADALPTVKRQYEETMIALTAEDEDGEGGEDPFTVENRGDCSDDAADYEAGECHGDEDRGHEEALYGDC